MQIMFPQLICLNAKCPKAKTCFRMRPTNSRRLDESTSTFEPDQDGNCFMFVPKPGVAGRPGGGIVEPHPLSQGLDWKSKEGSAKTVAVPVAESTKAGEQQAQPSGPGSIREEMRGSIA